MEKPGGTLGILLNWGTDVVSMMLGAVGYPAKRTMAWFNGTMMNVVCGAMSAAKKVAICVVLFVVILWVSILLYASFYHAYVPAATIVRPAHFKFRVCPSGAGMCSFPMANVTLGAENRAEVLGRGQQYFVLLEMEVPDSVPNRDLGMFMVMIRMFDRYGVITQESARAVSLKYQSDLLKMIETVILSPLYITGFAKEIQTLNVNLFDSFWDDYYRPSVGTLLEIHSRHLVFYSAKIHFHASYGGLRHYLFHYPLSCAFLGVLFNCLWLTPALLIPLYSFGLGLLNEKPPFNDHGDGGGQSQETTLRAGEGFEEIGRRGSGETEQDPMEVETVSRYVLQPFTMVSFVPPSSPSQGNSDVSPSTSTASTAKSTESCEHHPATARLHDKETAEGESTLRQRFSLGSPNS
ncbi:seipin-like isoform X2 [Babylonia areolata]|uniref:seipin-like isoform X2 n=1 Tax=Babylonia areolata TaxID=304850 RepID=UPI003FD68B3A